MTSFIQDVVIDLKKKNYNFSDTMFVLPSKRAGLFLRETISQHLNETIFSPEILSIEEFVERVSGLDYISNSELVFQFYESYLENTPKGDIEPFDKFSKWGQILIQDFNEIDRYLIEPKQVFEYLSAIKEIEHQHWSLDENPTTQIKNYLVFWKRLGSYYHDLKKRLSDKNLGYQGMVYKNAADKIKDYAQHQNTNQHVFLGFNALNTAEEQIIQHLLEHKLAAIYWDIDKTFVENTIHDAGLFIRHHLKSWKHFKNHPLNWPTEFYSDNKNINIIGTPKNIGQVKYVGHLLSKLDYSHVDLKKTAIVLGDETLLLPLLNSLPEEVNRVNITMGLPLHLTPMASLFEDLFKLHQTTSKSLYYKDVLKILENPYIGMLLKSKEEDASKTLSAYIKKNNIIYLQPQQLIGHTTNHKAQINQIFSSWDDNVTLSISRCNFLILGLKEVLEAEKNINQLNLEYLFKYSTIFNELERLNKLFKHIDNVKTLHSLFRELSKNETLDFKGEPLEGLQIMGMLETRALDFETVIITSVNEGLLPAGKSDGSFIPFDVKIENKLPTYKEKDAVYTYHFYRMLQRAKNIYIIYNTEPDVLNGGEKSRFITQLITEKKHDVIQNIISPKVPMHNVKLRQIKKTPSVVMALDNLFIKGLSPSSLTNYIRNPIDFYSEKILGINELETVEEHVAYNTLGTVIHNSLEDFYKPFEGVILTLEYLKAMKKKIDNTVNRHFDIEFKSGDVSRGKNLIIYEISKRYISNFLDTEIAEVKAGNVIKILAIETENQTPIYIKEINKTVNLKGKVDRVDSYNGRTRIIDYKTGRVEQGKVEIVNWDDILTDYDKYSKSFQVLMYAYLMRESDKITFPLEAGIISFKNLGSGFLKFATKPSTNSRKKIQLISEETLDAFEKQLKLLIIELNNPDIPFTEKIVT